MAAPTLDHRFSNRADWSAEFGLTEAADRPVPWLGLPAWAPGEACGPGTARVQAGDLYLADPDVVAAPFTTALDFAADVDAQSRPRWRLFGRASLYRRRPVDLTGLEVRAAIKPCDASGNITDPRPSLRVSSRDGGLVITSAVNGGVAWAVPRIRVRSVRDGLYRYDVTTLSPGGAVRRRRYGFLLVDEGIVE